MSIEVSEHYAYNTVKMMRPTYKGTIVIVEGEHDKEIYKNFFTKESCQIIIAQKRPYALNAIKKLNQDQYHGIVAIVDADFLYLDKQTITEPNTIITDSHDIYTMVFSSNSLEKIINCYGDSDKISGLEMPIRDLLLDRASIIGIFRWLSSPNKKDYRLKFNTLNINDCINKNSLQILLDNLIKNVLKESIRPDLDIETLKREIREINPHDYDLLNLCQGHDILSILFIGLRNKFGNKMGKRVDFSQFEIAFRISYADAVFNNTKMFKLLQEWERKNQEYKFLN